MTSTHPLQNLTDEGRAAVLLAVEPHALDDPLAAFLDLHWSLQAWMLKRWRREVAVGCVVGQSPEHPTRVLMFVDESLKGARDRLKVLLLEYRGNTRLESAR